MVELITSVIPLTNLPIVADLKFNCDTSVISFALIRVQKDERSTDNRG